MYKTDDYGEYRSADRWIRAWVGGFTICELREYADGTHRVHVSEPTYIYERPEIGFTHAAYMMAAKELGIDRKL